jgi:hypothetical protein
MSFCTASGNRLKSRFAEPSQNTGRRADRGRSIGQYTYLDMRSKRAILNRNRLGNNISLCLRKKLHFSLTFD